MIETILGILIVLLSIAGTVGLIKWTVLKFVCPEEEKNRIYAVLLKGDNADIELQMAMDTVEWEPSLKNAKLFAVDCGLTDIAAKQCSVLCRGTQFTFLTNRELADRLS